MKTLHLLISLISWISIIGLLLSLQPSFSEIPPSQEQLKQARQNTEPIKNISDGEPCVDTVTILFHNVKNSNTNLFSYIPSRGYGIGDNIVIKGQTLTDVCQQPISGIKINGELLGSQYSLKNQTISDKNGNFEISFQTSPTLSAGSEYSLGLSANYNNTNYDWSEDIILDNIKKFMFSEDGKNSTAEIRADPGTSIVSFALDKDSKKLTFIGTNVPNNQGQFTIMIPSELLSGNIFVQSSDNATVTVSGNDAWWSDTYGPILNENDSRHAYGLNVGKSNGFSSIFYYTLTPGEKKIEIVGTTVIPEFSFALPVLLISITSVIAFYRIKFRK